jgi:hypothetical protein
MSAGHAHVEHHGGNKGVALLIAVLALVLAFSETLGKSAQTAALAANIEASNLWAFFQAKTIRQSVDRGRAGRGRSRLLRDRVLLPDRGAPLLVDVAQDPPPR